MIFSSSIRSDLCGEYVARSSDENLCPFKRKMTKRFVMARELPMKVLLMLQKWLGRKNTTLLCVTRMMNRSYFNFKHQYNNLTYKTESLKLINIQSQCYRNTSKLMQFGKVYFDPLYFRYGLVVALITSNT